MSVDELIELAKRTERTRAESQSLEVKAARLGCPRRLYDTLSAFSNQDQGGVILFGLDEESQFAPVGVYDAQDLQKKVAEQCGQMQPPVRAVFTVAEWDGKVICSAEIPSIDYADRPCYYSGTGRAKGAYVRVGDADLPMTDYENYSYEAFKRHAHDDERVMERASASLLDRDRVMAYVGQMKKERPGFSRLSDEQACEMLAITRGGIPTLAAILNFGIYPQGYYPQLAITAVLVPGEEVGDKPPGEARFLDNKRIEGTLPEMLSEAMAFCIRNARVKTVIDPGTGERRDACEYPMAAVREAVLNALIHRDYSHFTEATPIHVAMYSNRMEIHSPGGLYGRMTVEDLGVARPDLRNPALATMSEFLMNTENRYSGIPTMRHEMAAAGLPAPVFENRRNEFVVTLYKGKEGAGEAGGAAERRGGDAASLLEFCAVPRSRREIADYLGIQTGYYAMQSYVRPLIESGELLMTIPDKPKSRNQRYVAAGFKAPRDEDKGGR